MDVPRRLGCGDPRHGPDPSIGSRTDLHDPGPAELIEELSEASAEFRDVWTQHDVRLSTTGRHCFHHASVGRLELVFEAAALRADPGLNLLLATADPGSPTETALRRLSAVSDDSFPPEGP